MKFKIILIRKSLVNQMWDFVIAWEKLYGETEILKELEE